LLDRAVEQGKARSGAPPVSDEGVLPVSPLFQALLPGGGLRRGSTVAVSSSTSLLFALLAEASRQGAWCALVGVPEAGMVAAQEAGLVLSRVALVPRPGADLVAITSVLLDGLDVVAVTGVDRLPAAAGRRLVAKARQRGAVLVSVGPWAGADVQVGGAGGRWEGLGAGSGRLRYRRLRVRAGGRGAPHRGRVTSVLLPGPTGMVAEVRSSVLELPVERGMDSREVG
jgi:hypothetical protein